MLQPITNNSYASVEDLLRVKDARTIFQLSGDQNLSSGQRANIQFLLDLAAGELDSSLAGRVPLPLAFQQVPASGQITFTAVPADNATVFLSDSVNSATLTFLNGGTATNEVNTASQNPATISGLTGAAIPLNDIGFMWENVGIVLSLQNLAAGQQGNIAITTTSPALSVIGMGGGGMQIPFVLKKWVCAKAAELMFGRRSDMPEQIRQAVEWADRWMDAWLMRKVQIPCIRRQGITVYQGLGLPLPVAAWACSWADWQPETPNLPPNQS